MYAASSETSVWSRSESVAERRDMSAAKHRQAQGRSAARKPSRLNWRMRGEDKGEEEEEESVTYGYYGGGLSVISI